ncbi:DUF3606 domain-containing protein [Pantoea dispersa]
MADNLSIRQPVDKRFINLHESWEVEYWTKTFGVTVAQLREAVAKVGNGTEKVRQFLGK